jgi:hypothetical protein
VTQIKPLTEHGQNLRVIKRQVAVWLAAARPAIAAEAAASPSPSSSPSPYRNIALTEAREIRQARAASLRSRTTHVLQPEFAYPIMVDPRPDAPVVDASNERANAHAVAR